jgi:YHS domain-containing protein/plastocyanin
MKTLTRLAAIAALALLAALPALAHDVKDPVCRMNVDSDTTKYHQKLGGKTFYFCSQACQVKFKTAPERYEKLAAQLEKQEPHEYTVGFQTDAPAVAGQPVKMTLDIRYADTKAPVKEFELVHERLIHLIMTTEDLSWFEHQHPTRDAAGLFHLTWTFPRPGKYRLYADFTPADGDNQVKPIPLVVGGGAAQPVPLQPDPARVKQVGDLRFELTVQPQSLRMEKPALLTYTVRDAAGRPVRNVQPYIGAMGHLIALSQDGKEFVHTHVLQSASHAMGEKEAFHVTPAMVTEKGPAFSFKLTLPSGGLYKTWAQFMHRNRVYTVPFTFRVQDLWAPAATASAPKPAADAVQRTTVIINGGFQPARVAVKAGQPVALTFLRKETSGCGNEVHFPSLGLKRSLKPGQKTTVSFTPQKNGTIAFSCGMGMYHGEVIAR